LPGRPKAPREAVEASILRKKATRALQGAAGLNDEKARGALRTLAAKYSAEADALEAYSQTAVRRRELAGT
jgi:hypothetical protein